MAAKNAPAAAVFSAGKHSTPEVMRFLKPRLHSVGESHDRGTNQGMVEGGFMALYTMVSPSIQAG